MLPGAEFPGVPFTIDPGTTYRVRIEDDGTDIRLSIDGTALLLGTVPGFLTPFTPPGALPVSPIVFYNRETATGTDTIDNVLIEGVPR